MGERDRDEALRETLRAIELMPPAVDVGRGQWVQLEDGQWVRAERAGYDLLDVDRQATAGEESQADPDDDDHIA